MKWWHRWRYRVWEIRRIEAIGKQADVKLGTESITYRIALFDLLRAEHVMRYHLAKGGAPVDSSNAAKESS